MKNVPSIRSQQSGFTLIELIVVIVILGILAATALPRFMDAGKEARAASMNAVRGALNSATALAHSRYLITPASSVNLDGVSVPLDTNGYPTVTTSVYDHITQMATLNNTDYWIIPPGTAASSTNPGAGNTEITYVPISLKDNAKSLTCYVKYAQGSASATPPTPPTVSIVTTNC